LANGKRSENDAKKESKGKKLRKDDGAAEGWFHGVLYLERSFQGKVSRKLQESRGLFAQNPAYS
jgi:hypothetical protein